ncbi:hypothetical protein [Planctomicrobium piriforme]|uniref:FHA domain-containing protein n=1 Tax=Planctomicrobium piriforme TaxID=1576369 RepID=A0A1I3CBU6_9PLAN|nr:hypothetical protein [Planctomicrobium piriforme]SFH71776.1 hypothetical protein SAMN05421753_102205 [Planctomicrobium piriforme]
MRVRLYEVGARSVGVVMIDEFPAGLALDPNGRLHSEQEAESICKLEDVGGQIFLKARCACSELAVNDAPLEEGPLMPGDRLFLRGHQYLVSYEQTSRNGSRPARFRIQN